MASVDPAIIAKYLPTQAPAMRQPGGQYEKRPPRPRRTGSLERIWFRIFVLTRFLPQIQIVYAICVNLIAMRTGTHFA